MPGVVLLVANFNVQNINDPLLMWISLVVLVAVATMGLVIAVKAFLSFFN